MKEQLNEKMTDWFVEETIEKSPTQFGNSSHIILPKRYVGKKTYVLVMSHAMRPIINWDVKKKINGKTYYKGEIVTGAGGSSGFWVEKEQAKRTALNKE